MQQHAQKRGAASITCGRDEDEVAAAASGLHSALLVATQHLRGRARRLSSLPAAAAREAGWGAER